MAVEFACRAPNCTGVVRGDAAEELLRCGTCGKAYRVTRKSADAAPPPVDGQEPPDQDAPPSRPRRKRRKNRRTSAGALDGLVASVSANLPFLLTRVLPVVALTVGLIAFLAHLSVKRKTDKHLQELAEKLWVDAGGVGGLPQGAPYVRGRLAILETQARVKYEHQDGNKPQHWVNTYLKPPLDDPGSIGSVILVEWEVFEDIARDGSGRALGLSDSMGRPQGGDPVMLKRWNCVVKLVDRKRRVNVYQAQLSSAQRTFQEGQKILATPGTVVSEEQLAVEFEKIRQFPTIGLDDQPPPAEPVK